ncbi:hypothetical protein GOBAR_DD11260 [Gossypium barbadense]|nr:hypothetical protein GOBAR_DD11260 [Gossypium barbadense]
MELVNYLEFLVYVACIYHTGYTLFLCFSNLNNREQSWYLLRRVGNLIHDDWIIGRDFNAILNDGEKIGGRLKSRVSMDEFEKVLNELALVDIKTNKGWFTWSNNRYGLGFVKEHLDRFMVSTSGVEKMSFLSTEVVRQSCLDHDAILLNLVGRKPNNDSKDPRLLFNFEACWEKERNTKHLIKRIWGDNNNSCNLIECLEKVRSNLGPQQHARYNRLKSRIRHLGSRIAWLKEWDKNTMFFHVCMTSRFKKNNIEDINDMDGNWVEGTNNVSKVAWNYFHNLFRSEVVNDERVMSHVRKCISPEMNEVLMGYFTDKEIMDAFAQMDPYKARGIDGLFSLFFRENWDVVGKDVL